MAFLRSFYFYFHPNLSSLILLNGNGTVSLLHSKEGLTQGETLDMFGYGIVVLPLIKQLKAAYSDVTSPWYFDDVGALSTYKNIKLYFNLLRQYGLVRGYDSKPYRSVLIVHPDNIKNEKDLGLHHGFKVCTGIRYLESFIGDDESKCDWLQDCTLK